MEEFDEDGDISSEDSCEIYDENFIIDKLPTDKAKLAQLLAQVKSKIKEYKQVFLEENSQVGKRYLIQRPDPTWEKRQCPSVPISPASISNS